jgi:hypothetical protein
MHRWTAKAHHGVSHMRPAYRSNTAFGLAATAGLFAAALATALPARAAHIEIGFLTCKVAGGIGFVFGSSKELECNFKGPHGSEQYHGSIDRFGIDLGFTDGAKIVWTVLAPSKDVPAGALAGNYAGVSAEATAGLGIGANALLGGSNKSIALQPLSVQGQEGLNVAVGVAELRLRPGA